MRAAKASPRQSNDDNLIPMINVVFLLLIFFMVAGTLRDPSPVETEPPDSSAERQIDADTRIYLTADGSLAVDAETVSLAELVERVDLSESEQGAPPDRLALRADGDVDLGRLQTVFDALGRAGVAEVELMTTWSPQDAR